MSLRSLLSPKKLAHIITLLLTLSAIFSSYQLFKIILAEDPHSYIELTEDPIVQKSAYISGAVVNPGVYHIDKDTNILKLIEKAGGLNEKVDDKKMGNINLSKLVFNEDHIVIPLVSEEKSITSSSENILGKININTATLAELDKLPGVGPSTAQKIIDARPYKSIDEIQKAKGIGSSTFDKLKDLITVE